jgi:hypothetical protein
MWVGRFLLKLHELRFGVFSIHFGFGEICWFPTDESIRAVAFVALVSRLGVDKGEEEEDAVECGRVRGGFSV